MLNFNPLIELAKYIETINPLYEFSPDSDKGNVYIGDFFQDRAFSILINETSAGELIRTQSGYEVTSLLMVVFVGNDNYDIS
jgi:hypothetical protein